MRRQVINPEDSKSEGFPEGWGEALRMGRNYTGLKKKKNQGEMSFPGSAASENGQRWITV